MSEITVTREIGGKTLSFSTGKLAGLADGSVVARLGDSIEMLVTATANKRLREGIDFFPLTVDFEERMYAAGKIPGSFFRREGRPSEDAILACRLIDRPLRPSFDDGFRCETQVVITSLAVDEDNPFDVLSLNGASAALSASPIPFRGPIGAIRLALKDGEWIPLPTYEDLDESVFELVVAGSRNAETGEIDIIMVEAGSTPQGIELIKEGAPPSDEETVARGLEESKRYISEFIDLQNELVSQLDIPEVEWPLAVDYTDEIRNRVAEVASSKLHDVIRIADKTERGNAESVARDETIAALGLAEGDDDSLNQAKRAFKAVLKEMMRDRVVNEGIRMDGRGPADIRPLSAEVGVVSRTHGSGLFQRGETQVLNLTTLGMLRMEQQLDTLGIVESKRFMHHYNFPPFSVGEAGFMRGPKRREIGHGALAEKALLPVVPSSDDFPYALRLVSEVLASNGSTSMASVCAATLSLMDAGVPISDPVAGIAMGLISVDGKYSTLTDIIGAEDALGDMDFKVAGTADVITALQLDTKLSGLPSDVLTGALSQAKEARLAILEVMKQAIAAPREELNKYAPRIESVEIPKDKIGEVIGPKGKMIREIEEETGASLEIVEEGNIGIVRIASTDMDALEDAKMRVMMIANPPEPDLGATYEGTVVNITKFGAFINVLPGRDGLLHISKIDRDRRVEQVEDYLELGQKVNVVLTEVDDRGKLSLELAEDAKLEPKEGSRSASSTGGGGGNSDGGGRSRDRDDRGDRGGSRDGGNRGGSRDGGNRDSGNRDSGNRDSGNRDSGNRDSGNRDSGNRDSGNRDSGNRDSGNRDSGNRDSGNRDSGNRSDSSEGSNDRGRDRGGRTDRDGRGHAPSSDGNRRPAPSFDETFQETDKG